MVDWRTSCVEQVSASVLLAAHCAFAETPIERGAYL